MRRKTIPKLAVLATGLTAAILVATINPAPAQAFPRAASCTGCHAAASGAVSTVTATPSTSTPLAGASYTVAITLTANPTGGSTGYGIVPIAPAVESTFGGNTGSQLSLSATMVAPTSAGTYSYTVYTNQGPTSAGLVGSKVYSITVAPVVTIPPTTVPPTTVPPTTVPPTTVPPTTVPPLSGNPWTPTGVIGTGHLSMYSSYGKMACASCHNGAIVPKPPTLVDPRADMKKASCSSCHASGGKEKRAPLFISLMNNPTKIVYGRCSDCHRVIAADGTGGLSKN